MSDEHEDLGAAVADLEEALSALRSDLERDADASEDELPPAERLRIATEVAIPTLEGLLAANLRTLEATRAAVSSVQEETAAGAEADAADGANRGADESNADGSNADGSNADGSNASGSNADGASADADESSTDAAGSRSSDADRPGAGRGDRSHANGADRVDAAVEEVRGALDGSSIPEDAPGRDLLQEARDLRAEIGSEVDDASDAADRSDRTEIPIGDSDDSAAHADGRSNDDPASDTDSQPDDDPASDADDQPDDDPAPDADDQPDDDPAPDADDQPEDDPAHAADGQPAASEPQRTADSKPDVDVDAELETIKQQVEHGGDLPSWSSDQSDGEWTFDDEDAPEDSGGDEHGGDGGTDGDATEDANDDTSGDVDDADGGTDDEQ